MPEPSTEPQDTQPAELVHVPVRETVMVKKIKWFVLMFREKKMHKLS